MDIKIAGQQKVNSNLLISTDCDNYPAYANHVRRTSTHRTFTQAEIYSRQHSYKTFINEG
jgi:hypothetical protein